MMQTWKLTASMIHDLSSHLGTPYRVPFFQAEDQRKLSGYDRDNIILAELLLLFPCQLPHHTHQTVDLFVRVVKRQ